MNTQEVVERDRWNLYGSKSPNRSGPRFRAACRRENMISLLLLQMQHSEQWNIQSIRNWVLMVWHSDSASRANVTIVVTAVSQLQININYCCTCLQTIIWTMTYPTRFGCGLLCYEIHGACKDEHDSFMIIHLTNAAALEYFSQYGVILI